MKKLCLLLLCCFISMPAIANDDDCRLGTNTGEIVLKYDGADGFRAKHCVDGRIKDTEKIDFCIKGDFCDTDGAYRSFYVPNKDKRQLCVRKAIYSRTIEGGNIILKKDAGTVGKDDVCYFCPKGYQYDMNNDACVDTHEQSCNYFVDDGSCGKNASTFTELGSHGCYSCETKENGSCSNGNVVFVWGDSVLGGKKSTEIMRNYVWTCLSGQGGWKGTPVKACNDPEIDWEKETAAGRAEIVKINNFDREMTHNNASTFVAFTGNLCAQYACKTGYRPNINTGVCEFQESFKQVCEESGGVWTASSSACGSCPFGTAPSSDNSFCECRVAAGQNAKHYKWNKEAQKCTKLPEFVELERNTCTKSGGLWSENISECYACEDTKQLKLIDNTKCECIVAETENVQDWYWDVAQKKCIKDPAVAEAERKALEQEQAAQQQAQQQRVQQQKQAQQQLNQRKNACVNSGGDFSGNVCTCRAEKNLVKSNDICECTNADFKFENAATGCVEKEDAARRSVCQRAVDAGVNAYWSGSSCVCLEDDKTFVAGKCQETESAKTCRNAGGIWKSNNCTCQQSGYNWTGTACEKSEALKKQELSAGIKDTVKGLTSKLDGWQKTLTVWKTKEGDFNKSRLASDSIAGVVLGTAGGLITSKVVKKNQVKSGFEDVQCTIGGQKVADWSDEFTVGVQ
ncbi:MAG: hypothetical protein J5679_02025 [Alphaproteobacteria bacterium]|nr:hypothetical protein [Alphaproteobacteria bacterium]